MINQSPELIVRDQIDKQLIACGWILQDMKKINLPAGTFMVKIEKITENKKQFLDLLLLADEQEDMIDKYLPDGDLGIRKKEN